MEKIDNVREEALKILIKVFEEKSYSSILIKNLGQKFSQLDRAFITEIVYGTIKYRLKIDYIIKQFSKVKVSKISPSIINIMRMGIYQINYMNKVPQSAAVNECVKLAKKYGNPGAVKYVNAVLRNYCRNIESVTYPDKRNNIVTFLSVYYSYPEWIVSRIVDEFGSEFAEEFLEYSNHVPPLTVRINKLKADKHTLKESLTKKGITVYDGAYLDDALILENVPGIESLEEYKEGLFTVQDESSMLSSMILDPKQGEFIMDMCSAPGTKSTYMAELMENRGSILSGDISKSKLNLVKQNCKRLGIDIIKTVCQDASVPLDELTGKADRLLLDVPCSGLGIMRKKPEIRWNREISDIEQIMQMQRDILNASCRYVKPGGIIVYSTCTVLRDENINVIMDFLRENKNFVLDDINPLVPGALKKETCSKGYIELYPNVDNVDGFFISRLRRVM